MNNCVEAGQYCSNNGVDAVSKAECRKEYGKEANRRGGICWWREVLER